MNRYAARYVLYALILAFAVWLVAAARSHADPPIVGPPVQSAPAGGESERSETIAAKNRYDTVVERNR